MKIYDNIEIVDLALKYKDNLILGDIHIGLEECINKEGVLIPRFQLEEVFSRLDKIFSKVKVKNIIINGDIKHEFGTISRQE
ncbi:MAG: phosphoesterase, partial [Candidatus Woesearchaeota archaeon]|nr:phosphoesterase [Candidatus Woesearchaeota archaeon]